MKHSSMSHDSMKQRFHESRLDEARFDDARFSESVGLGAYDASGSPRGHCRHSTSRDGGSRRNARDTAFARARDGMARRAAQLRGFARPSRVARHLYVRVHQLPERHSGLKNACTRRIRAADLAIVAVHTPEVPSYQKPHALCRASKRGAAAIPWPIALDNEHRIWDAYGISAWPTQLIFDRSGRLRTTVVGDGVEERVAAAVRASLRQCVSQQHRYVRVSPKRPDLESNSCRTTHDFSLENVDVVSYSCSQELEGNV